jgi:hypothetical protein
MNSTIKIGRLNRISIQSAPGPIRPKKSLILFREYFSMGLPPIP